MPTKKKPVKKTNGKRIEKKTAVTRKFLMDLAERIYDPKSRSFLRLCDGTLQNGPDPTNKKRPMHCGLGELYFAMTGLQPEMTGVDEDGVVSLAIERSALGPGREEAIEAAEEGVRALKLPLSLEVTLLSCIEDEVNADDESFASPQQLKFKAVLDAIPTKNDDGCGNGEACTLATFRQRSQRVAKQLRKAAELLPR